MSSTRVPRLVIGPRSCWTKDFVLCGALAPQVRTLRISFPCLLSLSRKRSRNEHRGSALGTRQVEWCPLALALPDGPAGVSGSAESTSPRRGSSRAVSSKGGTIQTWPQDRCLLRRVCEHREPPR